MMDIHKILKQLPHRYPFLLVDRVLELEKGKRIKALKNVTINEPFFEGHVPNRPVMPGVLMLEALAQGAVPVVSDLPANREWVVDGLNGLVVRSPADLPAALDRAIALSQSTRWREETAPANLRLVRDKALFADNLRRCLSLYQGLSR